MPIFSKQKLLYSHLLIICIALAPTCVQAELPEAIEVALTRAALTADDISIIITPIGDKQASRLPSVIQVIDSESDSVQPIAAPIKASNDTDKPIVDQQNITQQQRQLNAITDDPYTYRSMQNTPPLLPNNNATTDNTGISTDAKTVQASLVSHQPTTARTPASTMKLIPSFIALDTLGKDFVWYTRVYHTGIIIGNRLHGDLIIQGSGDPKMTHERLQELLEQIAKTGIRHIDGDIVIDSSIFKNVSKDPAAFDNAPLRPYNASPDGFLVNFNSIGISSQLLEHGQAALSYSPQLANYRLPNVVKTRSAACANASNSLAPKWQANELMLNAELPDSCGQHIFYVGYPDAKDFAARVIEAKWLALGNTISGEVIAQEHAYDYFSPLTLPKIRRPKIGLAALSISPLPMISYPSLSLTEQIYDINHFSNNVMTEQLTLSIGAYNKLPSATLNSATLNSATLNSATVNNGSKGDTSANTTAATRKATATSLYQIDRSKVTDYPQALQSINNWWQATLTTSPPYLTNGSGLCRQCTLSAANLDELLGYAYHHPSFAPYVNSLGVVGVSGTIMHHSERLPESTAIGRAWIKTGTLNNVTAMAGYVKGQSGQDYTVVGIINTEQALNPNTARPVLDAMLDWAAQQ